jgi:hypothetical protein
LDILAIVLVATLVAAVSASAFSGGGPRQVFIKGDSGTWIYPLDSAGSHDIPGPLGMTRVSFRGGEVLIEDSPCPTRSCVHMGAMGRDGQWLACLPNHVLVSIGGRGREGPDAGSR